MQPVDKVNSKPEKIFFTHYGDEWIRGSERCLLDLVTHIDREQFEPVVWCNAETMADEVKKLNVPVIHDAFPLMFGWQSPRFSFGGLRRLIRKGNEIVAEHDIQLLHANSGAPSQWLNFVSRSKNLPLVAHLHSRYPLRDRISLGLHHVSMAVGVSDPVVEQLIQDGMDENKTHIIPNGIDTSRLLQQKEVDLRNQLGISDNCFVIGTVASLIKRKGVDLILSALYQLLEKGVPARLVVIGDGPERQNLLRQAMDLGMQERVYFLGDQDNVVGLLRSGIDLFVSGAREEVFGLVLAEAGLAGLPVVAPKVGGIPGVI